MSVRPEIGRRYRRRDGLETGPLVENMGPDRDVYPFADPEHGETYTPEGQVLTRRGWHTGGDLIAEVPAAPAQPEGWSVAAQVLRAEIGERTGHWLSGEQSERLVRLVTMALAAPPAPPAPVEREVVVVRLPYGGVYIAREAGIPEAAGLRLNLCWTEPHGASRGEVTGEWERIGGEHG